MYSITDFNGHLMAFNSPLTDRLQQASSSVLALGEQDALSCINTMLRVDMAAAYGAWLKQMGLPLKESDRFAHDLTLQIGMHLQNGICVAKIGESFQYVTQSISFVIARLGVQSQHKMDAIQQELLPSMTDIRANQLPIAVLGRSQHGMYVKETVMLSGQSLLSVVPYPLYLHYGKGLADLLFKQSLVISYRKDGKLVKAEVSLAPSQMRKHYQINTLDEARQVILKQLIDTNTLGVLPVFDMKRNREIRQIPLLSILKVVPTSEW